MRARIFYISSKKFLDAYGPYQPVAADYEYITTIEASGPEDAWARMNRGSGSEAPELGTYRSMSVGDIIYIADLYYLCRPVGWEQLKPSDETRQLYLMAVREERVRA